MLQNKQPHKTRVEEFRLRMGFSPAHVALLLGHKDTSSLSDYEHGLRLPTLQNAFRLSVILRVPVEFLFPEHTTYVEAFAGGAQVFFRKPPSKVEVLNDKDYEVTNFYRCCQSHYEELVRYLRFIIASRHWFDILNRTDATTLTDIQRAARFLYLQKNCFGGLVVKQHFHYGVTQPSNFNPERIPAAIEEAHHRLARVQIESLPYEEVLAKYDRPTTLFYLDPPYWDRKLYKFNFTEEDFRAMQQRLAKLKGKFILSLDDHPKVREVFAAFRIDRTEIHYTAQRESGAKFGELLITNFAPHAKESRSGDSEPA